MKTGEECAEEVVQCDDKRVPPLLAVVELEGRVLIRVLCEWKGCMHVCVRVDKLKIYSLAHLFYMNRTEILLVYSLVCAYTKLRAQQTEHITIVLHKP